MAARWIFSSTRVQFLVECRNPVCDIVWLMILNLVKSSLMGRIQDQSVSTYVLDRLSVLALATPAEFWGTGHQCKDGYCHQLSVIFESVETFIRIVVLYLGVVPPTCILVLSILWLLLW